MCGIAGFVGPRNDELLRGMAGRIAHRGPDADGFFSDDPLGVHLAHRRLSIIDIGGGAQPMPTPDGRYAIVFNGEVYNFRELRTQLEGIGATFQSDHSDTEVLLLAWAHWREAMFDRLNGMWAFAILDRERRELILARDRFGKKPIYYHASGSSFAFASELTALRVHPDTPSALCTRALQKYFAYGFVPAPLTFLQGVSKLPGGHWMRVGLDSMSVETRRYWSYVPEPSQRSSVAQQAQWIDELEALLDGAVGRRLVADVPIGSFLSGGLDSSLVSALAARRLSSPLQTFSIGFNEATFDESEYARAVALHIGAEHHPESLSIERAYELLPRIATQLDEPIADSSILPTYLLCEHARRHVTVAMGGDGADELFAGYDPFKALRYARWYDAVTPRPVHRAVSMVAARLPVSHRYMSFDFRLKRMLRGLDHPARLRLPVWMAPLGHAELEELFHAPLPIDDVFSEAIATWDGCASADEVDRTTAFYVNLYLQDDILVKVDRASMLNSLEVRAPFLDIELVDFARRLPSDMKLRGSTTKWALRKIAERHVPRAIIERPKQGFGVPIGQWLRDGHIGDWASAPAVDRRFRAERLAAHRSGRRDERAFLWSDWILSHSHLAPLLPT